jgi:hypothetical protein
MKSVAALIAAFCLAGCGGYVMVESRSGDPLPPPPRPVLASHPTCPEICAQEAVEIALAEAAARGCTEFDVEEVECGKRSCKVELRAEMGRHHDAKIKVKVDRRTGEILSYKCRIDDDDDD